MSYSNRKSGDSHPSKGVLDDLATASIGNAARSNVKEMGKIELDDLDLHIGSAIPGAETPLGSTERLGSVVHATRIFAHLSQQELADMAGVGRRFVSELENGKPTLEIGRILKVCQALGIGLVARKR